MRNENDVIKLYNDCMNQYGIRQELEWVQEECAELIVAIAHFKRKRPESEMELIEELSDVQIMINRIISYIGKDKVDEMIDSKLDRVERRLIKSKEKVNG